MSLHFSHLTLNSNMLHLLNNTHSAYLILKLIFFCMCATLLMLCWCIYSTDGLKHIQWSNTLRPINPEETLINFFSHHAILPFSWRTYTSSHSMIVIAYGSVRSRPLQLHWCYITGPLSSQRAMWALFSDYCNVDIA